MNIFFNFQPGILEAVNYNEGEIVGRHHLITAGNDVEIKATVDRPIMKANGSDLAYIKISLSDSEGNENLNSKEKINICIEGPGEIIGFGSADPQTENFYQSNEWETYDGKLLAVVRSKKKSGNINVSINFINIERAGKIIQIISE